MKLVTFKNIVDLKLINHTKFIQVSTDEVFATDLELVLQ